MSLWMNHAWWRRLLTGESTLPGKLRPLVSVARCFFTCGWQRAIAINQEVACNLRHDVRIERQHEDFGIVEDVTAIAEPCQPLGRDAVTIVVQRSTNA